MQLLKDIEILKKAILLLQETTDKIQKTVEDEHAAIVNKEENESVK